MTFDDAIYKTLICVLTAQTHCFVLSIVLRSQIVTYVVSKSTNQDKSYWRTYKKVSTPAENSNRCIFFKQNENDGNSQVWKP